VAREKMLKKSGRPFKKAVTSLHYDQTVQFARFILPFYTMAATFSLFLKRSARIGHTGQEGGKRAAQPGVKKTKNPGKAICGTSRSPGANASAESCR
jgi:hypothetical protein